MPSLGRVRNKAIPTPMPSPMVSSALVPPTCPQQIPKEVFDMYLKLMKNQVDTLILDKQVKRTVGLTDQQIADAIATAAAAAASSLPVAVAASSSLAVAASPTLAVAASPSLADAASPSLAVAAPPSLAVAAPPPPAAAVVVSGGSPLVVVVRPKRKAKSVLSDEDEVTEIKRARGGKKETLFDDNQFKFLMMTRIDLEARWAYAGSGNADKEGWNLGPLGRQVQTT